jgi:hypothetical protein
MGWDGVYAGHPTHFFSADTPSHTFFFPADIPSHTFFVPADLWQARWDGVYAGHAVASGRAQTKLEHQLN